MPSNVFAPNLNNPPILHCVFEQQNGANADLSTSPDGTFAQTNYDSHRKLSMVMNLLPETNSVASSQDDMDTLNNSIVHGTKGTGTATGHDSQVAGMLTGTQAKCDSQSQRDGKSMTLEDSLDSNCKNVRAARRRDEADRKAGGYLIAVHRKLNRQDTYFLSYHKNSVGLFGVPLLIPCYEDGTNKDLYCSVWIQVARLLSPLPTATDQANHATDWWVEVVFFSRQNV